MVGQSTTQNEDEKMGHVAPNLRGDDSHAEKMAEGPVARGIERQTARLPSDLFLWAAAGSIIASASLQLLGKRQVSNFVGHWAPTFLVLGLYNKLVKVAGHDRVSE